MSHDRTKSEAPAGNGGPIAWAWATEHGAPERASTEQLVSWLARGELPPHTLVWRPGWGEWLPAMQVAELAHAFPSVTPGSRRVARVAHDAFVAPPPVPVAEYPRLRLLAKDVVGESAVAAPFTAVSRGLAPAPAARRSLRDLDRVQKDMVTSQVPAAAMLEAARAMKRLSPRVASGGAEGSGRLDLGTFGDQSLPASAQTAGVEPSSVPPRRTLSPHALELVFPEALDPDPSDSPWRPSRRYGPWLALGALVGGVLGLLAVRGPSPEAAAPAVAGAERAVVPPASSEDRVVTGACRPSLNAVRLDEHALRGVPVTVASLAGGARVAEASSGADISLAAGWVAVGYAQNHETAVGLALSPQSLELQRLVVRRASRPLVSMNPIVRDGELAFHTEREGASFAYARTVDAELPLRVGMNAQGLVAGPLEGQPTLVWELPRGSVISVPAIAVQPGGFTLATRVGQGTLRVGVMNERGEPLSKLGQLGDSNARFGRPALASGGGTTVLAVAARSADGSRQSLWLSHAVAGEPPLVLQPFAPTPDEPIGGGADLDMPAIAALPGGGFGLLFTQGHGWQRRVRLQRFSSTLAPLGAPVDVTTPDKKFGDASVGALYWVKDRLLAFHFRGRDAGASLWVSSIECEQG